MTLGQLKAQLRAGKNPRQLGGKVIGSGWYKTAYAVGPFVVKEDNDESLEIKRDILHGVREHGARMAPTVSVAGWLIQIRYRGMSADEYRKNRCSFLTSIGDMHHKNVGLDRRGMVVAFDW